jgi:hypothetical protein
MNQNLVEVKNEGVPIVTQRLPLRVSQLGHQEIRQMVLDYMHCLPLPGAHLRARVDSELFDAMLPLLLFPSVSEVQQRVREYKERVQPLMAVRVLQVFLSVRTVFSTTAWYTLSFPRSRNFI